MGRELASLESAVPTGLGHRLFQQRIWSLRGSHSLYPCCLHPPPLSPTQRQCCKRKGEQILKLPGARGKGNSSRGHRGKLWFLSLPPPIAFALFVPSVPASVTPFALFSPSKCTPYPP